MMFLASNGWSNDEGARIWPTFIEETWDIIFFRMFDSSEGMIF